MITPCIHFNGNCNEAIAFYKEALAAEVKEVFYAKDAPDFNTEELLPDNVMHCLTSNLYSERKCYGMYSLSIQHT